MLKAVRKIENVQLTVTSEDDGSNPMYVVTNTKSGESTEPRSVPERFAKNMKEFFTWIYNIINSNKENDDFGHDEP